MIKREGNIVVLPFLINWVPALPGICNRLGEFKLEVYVKWQYGSVINVL